MSNISMTDTYDSAPDELLPEYNFDYRKARPNRFAAKVADGELVVVLESDVAEVFTTSEAVNAVLRALINTMPKTALEIGG